MVPGLLGEERRQVAFTEDQHPVGDPGPDGEHERFGLGVRDDFGSGSLRINACAGS